MGQVSHLNMEQIQRIEQGHTMDMAGTHILFTSEVLDIIQHDMLLYLKYLGIIALKTF